MRAAKTLVYRGVAAVADQVEGAQIGVLTDEEYGPAVLEQANADGRVLAYPVEKSGQKLFDLEYGDETPQHIERWDPDYVKVLVRMNPDDDPEDTEDQLDKLAALSESLHGSGLPFLFELLVPASDAQLASVGGDSTAYDRDVRPGLVVEVIRPSRRRASSPRCGRSRGSRPPRPPSRSWPRPRPTGATRTASSSAATPRRRSSTTGSRSPPPWTASSASPSAARSGRKPLQRYLEDGDEATFLETVGQNYLHYVRTYLAAR